MTILFFTFFLRQDYCNCWHTAYCGKWWKHRIFIPRAYELAKILYELKYED